MHYTLYELAFTRDHLCINNEDQTHQATADDSQDLPMQFHCSSADSTDNKMQAIYIGLYAQAIYSAI